MEIIIPTKRCLLIFILFVVANLFEVTESIPGKPLCATQLSAANQACSIVYPEAFSPSLVATSSGGEYDSSSILDDDDDDDDDEDDDDEEEDDKHDHSGKHGTGGSKHDHSGKHGKNGNKHDHSSRRDHAHDDDNGEDGDGDDDDDDDDDDHHVGDDGHGAHDDDHHHRHGKQKHKMRRKRSPENEQCCRWLSDVDNDCMCEALRELPDFVAKLQQTMTIKVGRSCEFSFHCN